MGGLTCGRRGDALLEVAQLLIGFVVSPEQAGTAAETTAAPPLHVGAAAGHARGHSATQQGSARRAASSAATSPMAAFLSGAASVPTVRGSGPAWCADQADPFSAPRGEWATASRCLKQTASVQHFSCEN